MFGNHRVLLNTFFFFFSKILLDNFNKYDKLETIVFSIKK